MTMHLSPNVFVVINEYFLHNYILTYFFFFVIVIDFQRFEIEVFARKILSISLSHHTQTELGRLYSHFNGKRNSDNIQSNHLYRS